MKFPSLLLTCAAIFAAGCALTPPPDTHAADIQAVKDVEAAWVRDAATRDVEK